MASVTLNGTTFYPSGIAWTPKRYGRELVAADGTLNLIIRGTKFEWELTWEKATTAVNGAVYLVAALTTSFTYVDQFGTPYTVAVPLEGFQNNIGLIAAGEVLYYNITLRLRQL